MAILCRERREAEQRERERQEKERMEKERLQRERERQERERQREKQLSAVEAVDHHFQLSMELAKKVRTVAITKKAAKKCQKKSPARREGQKSEFG